MLVRHAYGLPVCGQALLERWGGLWASQVQFMRELLGVVFTMRAVWKESEWPAKAQDSDMLAFDPGLLTKALASDWFIAYLQMQMKVHAVNEKVGAYFEGDSPNVS